MADTGAHRIWTTTDRSAAWSGPRSPRGDVRRFDHKDTLSAGHSMEKKRKAEPNYSPLMMLIVVIEQWICLALGIACVASGIAGIFMDPGRNALAAHLAWLGAAYMPVLRITAAVCLVLGVVLVRLGWTSPGPHSGNSPARK
jgi:hypothetical protein